MTSEKAAHDAERGSAAAQGEKGRKIFEMGTSSNSRSFEVESWTFVPHQNYSLQLMQKIEPPFEGNMIPATVHEVLSFFRLYTSTMDKTQRISMSILHFNRFIWNCVFSSLKSLPLYYFQLFLSSYVPHKHLYIPAMMPLMFGYNLLMIVITLTLFVYGSEPAVMLLYYGFIGVISSNPWDRCDASLIRETLTKGMRCLQTQDFYNLIKSGSINKTYVDGIEYTFTFQNKSTAKCVPAPSKFSREVMIAFNNPNIIYKEFIMYSVFLVGIGLLRKQIFKRKIWKVMHHLHWILNVFYLGAILHILVFSLETKMDVYKTKFESHELNKVFKHIDFDLFADIVSVPPVLHFVAARSNRQINPTEDTCVLVFSNFVNYFLKGFSMYLIRRYCEHQYTVILINRSGIFNIYYLWPYYMSLVPLGDFLGSVFFTVNGLVEFLCFVVGYNIALECIQSAFPKLKWWIMLIIALPYAILVRPVLTKNYFRPRLVYAFLKSPMMLIEIFAIVCLYPVARLEDDITFHTGSPPPRVFSLAIRIVPIFLAVKSYLIFSNMYIFTILNQRRHKGNVFIGNRLKDLFLITLTLGIVYIVVKNFCFEKQNWRALFRPKPTWGPKDHIQRQLRKQYDSREYIASTSSRYLSRYLKSKLTSRMYRLDVCYETDKGRRRRSTVVAPQFDSFRYDDEKNKDV